MISRTSWTTFEMKTFGPDCGAAKNFLQNKIERFKIVYLGIFKISEHSCIKPWEFWSFELFSSSGSKYCLKSVIFDWPTKISNDIRKNQSCGTFYVDLSNFGLPVWCPLKWRVIH